MIKVGQIVSDITANMNPFRKDMTKVKKEGEKAAKGVESSFQQLGQRMRRTGTIMTAAVTAPVVAGFAKMSKEAALLEGAMAKFNVVFGDASDEMEQWVNEFRKEVPLARTEIIKAAAAMQDLLVPMGIAREEATGMSKQWLTLASRLAAFNDVPVDQALEAIRSGIAGMSRPLRQFGIDARQTVLQQVALQEGLIEAGEEMDEQARQQALLIQAYDQSSDALDGFEEQQDSLLLMQQEVSASIKDLAADYGKLLIPIAKETATWISDLAKTMQGFSDTTKMVITSTAGLAAAIGPAALGLGWAIKLAIPAVTTLTKVVKGLTAAMMKNPYLAVGAAIAYIGGRAIFARKELNSLHAEVSTLLQSESATLDQVNQKIAEIGELYSQAADNAADIPGKTAEDLIDPQIAKQLQKLVQLRDRLAGEGIVSPEMNANLDVTRQLLSFINTDLSSFSDGLSALTDTEALQTANATAVSFTNTLGLMNPKLNVMANGLEMAKGAASSVSGAMKVTKEEMSAVGVVGQQVGNIIGDALTRAVVQGKKLGNILSSVARQLASKAIMTGLKFLLPGGPAIGGAGFFKTMFGGIFHEGGIVGGSGNVPIMAKAGEGVFTEGQMKAMGGLMRGGGGMDEGKLQRAFDRALGNHLQKLGNDEIYAMAQKGRRGF